MCRQSHDKQIRICRDPVFREKDTVTCFGFIWTNVIMEIEDL